jgi:hypothetical protein
MPQQETPAPPPVVGPTLRFWWAGEDRARSEIGVGAAQDQAFGEGTTRQLRPAVAPLGARQGDEQYHAGRQLARLTRSPPSTLRFDGTGCSARWASEARRH